MLNRIVISIAVSFLACGVFLILLPLVFWFNTPELTQMQVVKMYWEFFIAGIAFMLSGIYAFQKYTV